jgi:hypothetical protein
MTTYSNVPADSRCECADPGCTAGITDANGKCTNKATCVLFRVDVEDNTGTAMCDECAEDALDSGLFAPAEDFDEDPEEPDTQGAKCGPDCGWCGACS